jgi:hypothetical protein
VNFGFLTVILVYDQSISEAKNCCLQCGSVVLGCGVHKGYMLWTIIYLVYSYIVQISSLNNWITVRHMCLLFTSHHRTTEPHCRRQFLTSDTITSITVLPFNRNFKYNCTIFNCWAVHTHYICFLLLLPPCRWPHGWPKHVRGYCVLKLQS